MGSRPINLWRKAALGLSALTILFSLAIPAYAAPCKVNCLTVYSNTLTNMGTYINGTVKLVDETGSGGGARSAVVQARWTRPDGSTLDQYDVIGTRLRAEFRLYTDSAPGTYTLTVIGATKAGYSFDPQNPGLLTSQITIGTPGNIEPVAVANSDVTSGAAPLLVTFDATGSSDQDGSVVAYDWVFGDGGTSTDINPMHTYTQTGLYSAVLTVTDDMGASNSQSLTINVTDASGECVSNCMVVDQVAMRYRAKKEKIIATIWLQDENGNSVSSANIDVVWTLPDGTSQTQSAQTNKRSKARFNLGASTPGIYTLTVANVTKAGFTYDMSNNNVTNGMIEISP